MTPIGLAHVAWLAPAYLLGAVPSSYVVARLVAGVDLRQHGSKNLGATNLFRLLGWKAAVPVAAFDAAKGAAPVLAYLAVTRQPAWWALVVGAAAVLGHVFSPFVGFRGGKGVATAAGVFLAYLPAAIGLAAVVWVGLVAATGYVSVGSIAAAMTFPVWVRLFYADRDSAFWVAAAVALFVIFNHRSNIRRLMAGTESRFRRGGAGGPRGGAPA
jgi:acyl phosphate:glycerol-3-phosphate acyltransferase